MQVGFNLLLHVHLTIPSSPIRRFIPHSVLLPPVDQPPVKVSMSHASIGLALETWTDPPDVR